MKKTITTQYNSFTTSTGTTFYTNESQTYFYATWVESEGPVAWRKQKRISKKEYEQAKREHELEVAAKMHESLEELNREQNEQNKFVNITEEELEKLVAETEESNTDEAIEQVLDEMAEDDGVTAEEFIEKLQKVEKEKKVRKAKKAKAAKKNAAYSYSENGEVIVTLTEKQCDFVRHLPDTNFWENGIDSMIWTDVLCDEIGGQFAGKPMTVGAMISTLCEKGLAFRTKERINKRKCTAMGLTELGKRVFATGFGLN